MKEHILIDIKNADYQSAIHKFDKLMNKYVEIGFIPIGSPTVSYCGEEYIILLCMVR